MRMPHEHPRPKRSDGMSKHDAELTDQRARLSRASVQRFSLYCVISNAGIETVCRSFPAAKLGEVLASTTLKYAKIWPISAAWGNQASATTLRTHHALRHRLGVDPHLERRSSSVRAIWHGRYCGIAVSRSKGFQFVALFDADPNKIGQTVDGLPIHDPAKLPGLSRRRKRSWQ